MLHYFGGLTLDAIAFELGLTKTAVGTRLHRARKMLGDQLGERGLKFEAGELSALIAMIVPAAVIATLARSAGALSIGAASGLIGASAGALALGVTQMLNAAGGVVGTRPIAAAAAAVLCLAGSGVAWVGPRSILDVVTHPSTVGQWLDRR